MFKRLVPKIPFLNSFVSYVKSQVAIEEGLFKTLPNHSIYLGVETNRIAVPPGRDSIRILSKKSYTRGLFILDLAHMPGGVCGTWPSFSLLGSNPNWVENGKMVIIESKFRNLQLYKPIPIV